ncbi:sigma-54 dependent transcriptional regulator [Mucilaginibacter sp. RS28]|uniref:Sigma-54 dependent transcriptional regulator n=1 Tax=Mucilaginibacter straminoryzae TaxID=2932774 RepID=A0A9X2BAC0_9SPHI|nr:sigma-54 dependent transcriptional regulator [Mucilaginibacter straminoryzae]MCJ8208622.1 sigma-54 dependent transcriptional regulator [Mucilaginibacter straminoryzae]
MLIFIVEDDPWFGELLKHHISLNPDYEVCLFSTAKECLEKMYLQPMLVSIDLNLPDSTGSQLYRKIRKADGNVPVVVISAQESVSEAVALLKSGVYDYILKDENTRDLFWNTINRYRETLALKEEVRVLEDQLISKYDFSKIIKGNSKTMQPVFALMEKAARTNINVLISGETGTGKELVAKAIHANSSRRKKPFVAVNMAAIPTELVESELFGYEKGAFTGAMQRKIGKFEEANGGTLFLDEIGELNISVQSKLLRALQEREITRIGGSGKIPVDIRLITATNRELADEVKNGTFREDLYYRIFGLPIELPPLRHREGDILFLAGYFLREFVKANNVGDVSLTRDAEEKLIQYTYPGNVRELRSIIELAAVLCEKNHISPGDIRFKPVTSKGMPVAGEKSLRDHTLEIINYYLSTYQHNIPLVAEKLKIGKSTIYKILKEGKAYADCEG